MHFPTVLAITITSLASASTAQLYWRNVPPPIEDYRAVYRDFKSSQSHYAEVVKNIDTTLLDIQSPQSKRDMNVPQVAMPVLPNTETNADPSQDPPQGELTISDILPSQRTINIFASLTRNIATLTTRLDATLPGGGNTTLLAPLNSVMQHLPRKPWEDRPDDMGAVHADRDEDKAQENLNRFVLEHAVGNAPWQEGKDNAVMSLWSEGDGKAESKKQKIWWEWRGGGSDGGERKRVIMPGEVVVDRVLGRVGNGEIWALRGVINYE